MNPAMIAELQTLAIVFCVAAVLLGGGIWYGLRRLGPQEEL